MFLRKPSDGLDYPDDVGAMPQEELDALIEAGYKRLRLQQAEYESFLEQRDFSTSGDLLPYFARDFFHDASFESFTILGHERKISFRAEAMDIYEGPEDLEEQHLVDFDVVFTDVVSFSISVEREGDTYGEYRYSEIDGLEADIADVTKRLGRPYHSLTIETGWGGWIRMVFHSVDVTPVDRIEWLRLLRNPEVRMPSLYGLGVLEMPDGESPA